MCVGISGRTVQTLNQQGSRHRRGVELVRELRLDMTRINEVNVTAMLT